MLKIWAIILVSLSTGIHAQEKLKPLDPAKAHTAYSFPVSPGTTPLRFQVELDQTSTVTGVSVFRKSESSPFQFLPACTVGPTEQLTEYDEGRDLLEHADLNFDGFQDVELLQFYHPHLGTKVFCVYVWNRQAGRYRYAPEIPGPNPVPHPGNRTITAHQDWQGGLYADSTYRWTGAKFVLIEEKGRVYGSDDPLCGFTDHCNKLVNGKMIVTLLRPVACSDDRPDPPLVCPAGATHPAPNAPRKRPSTLQKK